MIQNILYMYSFMVKEVVLEDQVKSAVTTRCAQCYWPQAVVECQHAHEQLGSMAAAARVACRDISGSCDSYGLLARLLSLLVELGRPGRFTIPDLEGMCVFFIQIKHYILESQFVGR